MMCLTGSIHLLNSNASPAHSADVLAALPTRATRDTMNGNHTNFFIPGMADVVHGDSNKV
jgi:hypothetical protein